VPKIFPIFRTIFNQRFSKKPIGAWECRFISRYTVYQVTQHEFIKQLTASSIDQKPTEQAAEAQQH
jgi:hypothetical protein